MTDNNEEGRAIAEELIGAVDDLRAVLSMLAQVNNNMAMLAMRTGNSVASAFSMLTAAIGIELDESMNTITQLLAERHRRNIENN